MRVNTATIISGGITIIGFSTNQPHLWIPMSVFIAGLIDLLTRSWVVSDRIGSARTVSVLLKFFLSLNGFYAMIGQVVCLGLVIWWFAR